MSEPSQTVNVTFVDAAADVTAALAAVDEPVVGIDVERADAEHYFRRAALVQIGVAGRCVLLDATTLEGLDALDRFLADGRTAVFHAMENDLAPLASKGVEPHQVADTAVAAAILGLPTGLASLLAQLLDVELDDDKGSYQRADWEARPLTAGMTAYAAGDVVHLPQLWARLAARLEDTGRRAWYDEDLAAVLAGAHDDQRDWTRVKGATSLPPEQRAVLRSVWEERERLAREHDIAPNRLLHDDVLRDLATDPPRTQAQLVRRSHRRRSLLRRHAEDLLTAVQRGLEGEPERSSRSRRPRRDDRDVYDALRRRRAELATELGLDPGVLAPARPLWQAVTGDPADAGELCQLAGLNHWRTELLAEPLWQAYRDAREHDDHDLAEAPEIR